MKFHAYYKNLNAQQKRDLAKKLDTSVQYLYQIATRRRLAGAKFILNIEAATDGHIKPTDIRAA